MQKKSLNTCKKKSLQKKSTKKVSSHSSESFKPIKAYTRKYGL